MRRERTPSFGDRCRTGLLAAAVLLGSLALTGCSRATEPLLDSRDSLGTVVSLTAYRTDGIGESIARRDIDRAFETMEAAGAALDIHNPDSAVAQINSRRSGELPVEAFEVISALGRLGVEDSFSYTLLELENLYDFEGTGSVPATDLAQFMASVARTDWSMADGMAGFSDRAGVFHVGPGPQDRVIGRAGLDFGGAAKGLALDRAAAVLRDAQAVSAALVTAGSTTLTVGSKADGKPWRIGIEDPRDPSTTVATVEAPGAISISTSGDYQRYFERDGVRYHHILDPATGLPARGLRSLSVVGEISGLDSDILSTALFVMGPDRATAYAEEHSLGLIIVDAQGRTRIVPGPDGVGWRIEPAR